MIPYGAITTFSIGPVTFQAWGTMVAAGFIAAILLILHLGKKEKFDADHLLNMIILAFVGSIIGSRMLYVAYYIDEFSDPLDIFRIWNGGMVYYGGFILSLILIWLYVWKKKLNFWKYADIITPGLALGMTIGRIGCHLVRDHVGEITTVQWGVQYGSVLRHEPAMYLVIANLIGFVLVMLWWRREKYFDGAVFLFFMAWYGVTRFITEFFRASDIPDADPRYLVGGAFKGLTFSQFVSVAIVAICIYFIWRHKSRMDLLTKKDKVLS